MQSLWQQVRRLCREEDGPTAVEYAVMIAFIILVCISGISAIGTRTGVIYQDMASELT